MFVGASINGYWRAAGNFVSAGLAAFGLSNILLNTRTLEGISGAVWSVASIAVRGLGLAVLAFLSIAIASGCLQFLYAWMRRHCEISVTTSVRQSERLSLVYALALWSYTLGALWLVAIGQGSLEFFAWLLWVLWVLQRAIPSASLAVRDRYQRPRSVRMMSRGIIQKYGDCILVSAALGGITASDLLSARSHMAGGTTLLAIAVTYASAAIAARWMAVRSIKK